MPKAPVITFVCSECGGETLRWAGQCPHCRAWNTLQEFVVPKAAHDRRLRATANSAGERDSRPVPLTEVELDPEQRIRTTWEEVDRVLGGGIVPGSLVLVGGEPGVGKSTLLIQLAGRLADLKGHDVLYATGEESAKQVKMRAGRLGIEGRTIHLQAENDLDRIVEAIEQTRPALAIVDSIQTVYDSSLESAAGSVSQVREAAARLMRLAKQTGVPVFLVGHVTKEGAIAGPRVLEHIVDTVLYLEGDRQHEFRILRTTKNRFGGTDEIGILTMTGEGLAEVEDPGAALLSGGSLATPGTAVTVAIEGSRPFLVEVQTLVGEKAENQQYPPRRSVNGFDQNRLHMLLAVMNQRAAIDLKMRDVYVNVAGGFRLQETVGDLGLALGLAGNLAKQALPEGTLVLGEVGLTGEVRRVSQLERRVQEGARRGFRRAIIPANAGIQRLDGIEVVPVRSVKEAAERAFALFGIEETGAKLARP